MSSRANISLECGSTETVDVLETIDSQPYLSNPALVIDLPSPAAVKAVIELCRADAQNAHDDPSNPSRIVHIAYLIEAHNARSNQSSQ